MALIDCDECGKKVSDKAASCPNCGAPIGAPDQPEAAPANVLYQDGCFIGAKDRIVQYAVKAIQSLKWKVDSADAASGLVSFTTGVTWGSWSGVSGSIYFEEVAPNKFKASGTAKQNVKGGQFLAMNIGNEAQKKVEKVLEVMRQMVA